MDVVTLEPDDFTLVLAMNNAAVPNVSERDPQGMADLIDMSDFAVALIEDGVVLGFMVALPPDTAYASPNYKWFDDRYQEFLYVDRIVVSPDARNRGLGAELYELLFQHVAEHGVPRVTCEVNLDPPNPGSLRFHQRLGFAEVGQLVSAKSGHLVCMLAKES
ncbi:MAG: GNAT family N-acetyltransferase [Kibdelosporangium sp.]